MSHELRQPVQAGESPFTQKLLRILIWMVVFILLACTAGAWILNAIANVGEGTRLQQVGANSALAWVAALRAGDVDKIHAGLTESMQTRLPKESWPQLFERHPALRAGYALQSYSYTSSGAFRLPFAGSRDGTTGPRTVFVFDSQAMEKPNRLEIILIMEESRPRVVRISLDGQELTP